MAAALELEEDNHNEEDYMSDNMLCYDIRPGVVAGSALRKIQIERTKNAADSMQKQKSQAHKIREHEQRVQGLNTALDSDNKGFKLLAKMGYQPGMSIGKQGLGRTEPVQIEFKSDRTGLGQKQYQKRKLEEISEMREIMKVKCQKLTDDYSLRKREIAHMRQLHKDILMSRKACIELDQRVGLEFPAETKFWPTFNAPCEDLSHEEEYEEEQEESLDLDLKQITTYLRDAHQYCIWCGTKFDDDEDLSANCPGDNRQVHS